MTNSGTVRVASLPSFMQRSGGVRGRPRRPDNDNDKYNDNDNNKARLAARKGGMHVGGYPIRGHPEDYLGARGCNGEPLVGPPTRR
jgi:hypothetical protein